MALLTIWGMFLVHCCSFLTHSFRIDDIEDNSILRRGVPVAHSIYGVASTINAANYVFFLALEKVQQLGHESVGPGISILSNISLWTIISHSQATQVYTEQLLELHRGQGMEIYWRDNFTCPTESEYQQMTIRKTGGLFMLAIRLMQLFSANKRDFSKLTAILGLYFQIRDDYCNLVCKEVCFANHWWYFVERLMFNLLFFFLFSTPKTKVSVKIWPKGNSVFQSFMQSTIRSKIDRCYVSFFKWIDSFRAYVEVMNGVFLNVGVNAFTDFSQFSVAIRVLNHQCLHKYEFVGCAWVAPLPKYSS